MTGGGILGGGVIFVVAALLWAAVLVPTWVRRREFRAAEQNALRLQRTLRVLAESSEIPDEVRLEANAREAVAHEKLLLSAERRQQSERAAALSDARTAERRAELLATEAKRREAAVGRAARRRTPLARRMRSLSALVALLAVVGTLMGAGLAIAGMGAVVLGGSVLAFFAATGALVLLAPGRAQEEVARRLPEVPSIVVAEPVSEEVPAASSGRTPAEHAAVQTLAAERIARARAQARARAAAPPAHPPRAPREHSMLLAETKQSAPSGHEVRAAATPEGGASAAAEARPTARPAASQQSEAPRQRTAPPKRTLTAQRSQELAAATRLKRMGVVGDTSVGLPDLDAAMRRRRDVS